jgi:hypothetical protein
MGDAATPYALSEATLPASKRFTPPAQRQRTGDGCAAPTRLRTQGDLEERPVRATLELWRDRISVNAVDLQSGARRVYRGNLSQSLCDIPDRAESLLDLSGQIGAGKGPRLEVSVRRNSYFEVDRSRLRLEASEHDSSEALLTLWETPDEQFALQDTYQKALGASDDIEAVLNGPNDTLLVASLGLGSRALSLTELSGKPLVRKRQVVTGLACSYHSCHASLSAFEAAGMIVLVPVVSGEDCGAKCTQFADGELWTLTEQGFHLGGELPDTDEHMGGLNYESSSSSTRLRWVDGDGIPPLEILVEHSESGEDSASRSVFGFDTGAQAYSKREVLGALPPAEVEALERACGGELTAF